MTFRDSKFYDKKKKFGQKTSFKNLVNRSLSLSKMFRHLCVAQRATEENILLLFFLN